MERKIKIKQAVKCGYIECPLGSVVDLSFPDSKLRRARVQGGGLLCPTLMASEGCGGLYIIFETESISEYVKDYLGVVDDI